MNSNVVFANTLALVVGAQFLSQDTYALRLVNGENCSESSNSTVVMPDEQERERMRPYFDHPLKPTITTSDIFAGDESAKKTLVSYIDFQCSFCARVIPKIEKILHDYQGEVKWLVKHNPLDFHPQSMLAAQYFEAVKMVSPKDAFTFLKTLMSHQSEISKGSVYLDSVIVKMGLDLEEVKDLLSSEEIIKKIERDKLEAKSFEFSGTPAIVLHGIPILGARPYSHFQWVMDEWQRRGD